MTFKNLQDDLIEDVQNILKDIRTKNTDEEEVEGITGYAHRLPITQSDEDDPAQYFPYFIVRFDMGKTANDDDCWHVATDIIIGVHDTALEDGHEHILVAIQRIVDRYASDPWLLGKYRADQDIQWVVQEDDTYPFYFGAVAINFSVPKIGRREPDYV
ncbi:MAG: hypothetical protein LUC83_02975 [Clostridiales bacterium]|nr:hypothetical protein [Clostridiales bacterium]